MSQSKLLANRLREPILNGTFIAYTNFKAQVENLTWEQATCKIENLNTIAQLVFHIHYYVHGILNVFEGGGLDIRDKYSFDMKPITVQEEWEHLTNALWEDTEKFASHVEAMSDEKLQSVFVDEKYGFYHRNIDAMIEHAYYHLGQVVLIKKMVLNSNAE